MAWQTNMFRVLGLDPSGNIELEFHNEGMLGCIYMMFTQAKLEYQKASSYYEGSR